VNIAIFTNGFPKVSETFISDFARGLKRSGIHITLFPRHIANDELLAPSGRDEDLVSNIVQPTVLPRGRAGRRYGAALDLMSAFARHPVKTSRVMRAASSDRLHSRSNYPFAIRPLLHGSFDLWHAHFGQAGIRALAMRSALEVNVPLITTFHGFDIVDTVEKEGRDIYDNLFHQGDWFTVGSPYMRERLIELGAPEEKLSVIPMPTGAQEFTYRERLPVSGRKVRILTVARLVEVKGHHIALRALSHIRDEIPEFQYDIIGDGPERQSLEELTTSLDLENNVVFHGALSGDTVKASYDMADIFLLPGIVTSEGRAEGQGVVFGEAQASGLPILTTNAGGCPHAVKAGESAIVVEHSNVDQLATGLVELLNSQSRWKEMGSAGRNFVEENFSREVVLAEFTELYERLLSD
jgi:colanic acid/amylovoran biosynthesis glycosyltransferase